MEKEKRKYLVYYNNGYVETIDRLSVTFLHMIEVGVVKLIFDCNENKAWTRTEDGLSREFTVTHVSGLD